MSTPETTPIITAADIKRECIIYIGKNNIKSISYVDLFNYLTHTRKLKIGDGTKIFDNKLSSVLGEISYFDYSKYSNHGVPSLVYHEDPIVFEEAKNKNKTAVDEHHAKILNTADTIKESVFDTYRDIEKELVQEDRIVRAELDSSNSLRISWWSFWIAIVALALSGAQLGVDYWDIHHGKDYKFEKSTMHSDSTQVKLDSMQVEQNKIIIELLKNKK